MAIERDTRRYACIHDLNNYFKKKDLLGGLTDLEQEQLRKNIGIIDYTEEGGQSKPLEVTYAVLNDNIGKKSLVIGARYVITDFQTIYSSNVTNSSGQKVTWGTDSSTNPSPIWKLIVTAITNNRLDPRVVIDNDKMKDWVIEYDPTKETLEDGVTTKGRITFMRDNHFNSAHYDFKNIKFRRTAEELDNTNLNLGAAYGDFYTFSDLTGGVITDSSELHNTKHNELKQGCTNNIFLGDTYDNVLEADCKGNTFLRGCHDTTLRWNSVNNMFNENVCYMEGSLYNKVFPIGDTSLSMTITKTIHKSNEATIISFLDPMTYAYQIIQI
jgi:hypothetical protein